MNRSIKQSLGFNLNKLNISKENLFIILIIFGIPLNLYKNRFYDNSWTVGEWLISYSGGFVRRGLPGTIIHKIASQFLISPIILTWVISVLSILSLAGLILYSCKNCFDKSFLLSHLIILAPISEDYLVRKDSFLVLIYGMNLLLIRQLYFRRINIYTCLTCVNFLSILAILSHESFGIWALPSLILIIYINQISSKENIYWSYKSFLKTLLMMSPSFVAFILCWLYKGNLNQAISIHEGWQELKDILPSQGALEALTPDGAIGAIGWGTAQVYTSSLFSQFNLLIFWHPGMWLLTIFIVMRLFIGKTKPKFQKAKRLTICLQLIAFLPMFLFVDIGRWIFMWLASSALLFGFMMNVSDIDVILKTNLRLKGSQILPKLIPGFISSRNYNLTLLLIGLPHCCWSVGRYIVSNPIGFAFKNVIFYFKLLFL